MTAVVTFAAGVAMSVGAALLILAGLWGLALYDRGQR